MPDTVLLGTSYTLKLSECVIGEPSVLSTGATHLSVMAVTGAAWLPPAEQPASSSAVPAASTQAIEKCVMQKQFQHVNVERSVGGCSFMANRTAKLQKRGST